MDNTRLRVLLVDDDERLLKAAQRLLRKELDMDVAVGAVEALECLANNPPYAVIVSDQSMPDVDGTTLLANVAERWPHTVRIMLTGNNNLETAVKAVNTGQVFRFIGKPCQPEDLLEAIEAAGEQHKLMEAEKQLLERTLMGSVKMLTDILALSRPDFYKRSQKLQHLAKLLAPKLGLKYPWQLTLAASLCQLGIVALPENVAARASTPSKLTPEEQEQVLQAPQAAADLIRNIPKLEAVADAVLYSRKQFDGTGFPFDDRQGKSLPALARILSVLIDLVELTENKHLSQDAALELMMGHEGRHDPELLAGIAKILPLVRTDREEATLERTSVSVASLKEGDVVAEDIHAQDGKLMLAAGSTLTKTTIQRLFTFARMKVIKSDVVVLRPVAQKVA